MNESVSKEPTREQAVAQVWHLVRTLVLATTAVWSFRQLLRIALEKRFATDEFQYAHAAWALAHGQVQYRDFFEVHFPLTYQYMSLVFWFGEDDPTAILDMRVMMLPVMGLMAWAAWQINARHGRDWALLGPILLFTLYPFTGYATEIRHDPIAYSLLLGSIACLHARWPRPAIRGFVAGVMVALCCWGTQKAFMYCSMFLPALLTDVFVNKKRGNGYLLASPLHFLFGSGLVVSIIAIHITMTDNWVPLWHWCFAWAADYQKLYPGFSWQKHFVPMLTDAWWYLLLAVVGVVSTARNLRRNGGPAAPDQLLLGALVGTFLAMSLQQAPWGYNAVGFLAVICVFAARGLIVAFAWFRQLHREGHGSAIFLGGTLAIFLGFTFLRTEEKVDERLRQPDRYDLVGLQERLFDDNEQNLRGPPDSVGDAGLEPPPPDELEDLYSREPAWERFENEPEWAQYPEPHNEYQLRVLRKIGELTDPGDVVYDNTGCAVARPHAYFFFYTELSIRTRKGLMLETEVPDKLIENGAVMVIRDKRYHSLPKRLKAFIEANYQPYNGDLKIWGRKVKEGKSEFRAVVDGTYMIHPRRAVKRNKLWIDGEPVDSVTFELERGVHRVEIKEGGGKAFLLWVPRNGELWQPNPKAKHAFF